MKFQSRKIEGESFSEIILTTPVAPKTLPSDQTLSAVLEHPRSPVKILLVVPSQHNVYGIHIRPAYPSLGILWIAATLKQAGHEVSVVDMDADEMNSQALLREVSLFSPQVVGFTAVTPTYNNAVQLAKMVREQHPEIKLLLGGIHATIAPEECVRSLAFDCVIVGEGEITVVEVVDALIQNKSLHLIHGIAYQDEQGSLIQTTSRWLTPDLDDYPLPAAECVRNLNHYAPATATALPAVPVMVSRGCPGKCTYCQTKIIFGQRTRFRSPENVVAEIRLWVENYGVKEIHFLDDVITANPRFVKQLCALLRKEPYRIHLEVANGLRADMVNESILRDLQSVGLKNVGFGVETGSDRIATLIKKGITKDQVRKAMATAKKIGLETWCFFILGLPGDDRHTIQETIDFAIELDPKFAKFLILKPFPGSEVYYQLDEKGLIDSRDYSLYGVYTSPVHHLETLSAAEILKFQQQAFRKFYLRPHKMWEHLRGLRSWGRWISFLRGILFIGTQMIKRAPAGIRTQTGG